jgi:hypothetical protein
MCLTFRVSLLEIFFFNFLSLTRSTDSNGKSSLCGTQLGFICIWETCFLKCDWVQNDCFYTQSAFWLQWLFPYSLNIYERLNMARVPVLGTRDTKANMNQTSPQRHWSLKGDGHQINKWLCTVLWGHAMEPLRKIPMSTTILISTKHIVRSKREFL